MYLNPPGMNNKSTCNDMLDMMDMLTLVAAHNSPLLFIWEVVTPLKGSFRRSGELRLPIVEHGTSLRDEIFLLPFSERDVSSSLSTNLLYS